MWSKFLSAAAVLGWAVASVSAFGATQSGDYLTVDTGGGLVFVGRRVSSCLIQAG